VRQSCDVRRLPYTVNEAAVCRRVAGEADRFGEAAGGTEHILRAVLRRRSIVFQVLADLGVDPDHSPAAYRVSEPPSSRSRGATVKGVV
jgi:Clp amino terminal domain, pathogenicity island component